MQERAFLGRGGGGEGAVHHGVEPAGVGADFVAGFAEGFAANFAKELRVAAGLPGFASFVIVFEQELALLLVVAGTVARAPRRPKRAIDATRPPNKLLRLTAEGR